MPAPKLNVYGELPGSGSFPQVVAVPLTVTLRPSALEQPQPFTVPVTVKQIAPVVLKLPLCPPLTALQVVVGPVNVAVTDCAAVIVIVQVAAVPLQAPLQPPKLEPDAAVAVSVTLVPLGRVAEQAVPQLMPPPVTVPLPVLLTVRV